MKALMIKDIVTLYRSQKRMLIVILIGCYLSTVANRSFALAYLTLLGAIIGVSAISYDEQDNGMSFLFTMPLSRRIYVQERYLFSFLCGVLAILPGTVLIIIMEWIGKREVRLPEDLQMALVLSFLLLAVMISVMIPLHLKFGGERAVVARTVFFLIAFICFIASAQLLENFLGINVQESVVKVIQGAGVWKTLLFAVLVACVLIFISEKISERIMQRKEF